MSADDSIKAFGGGPLRGDRVLKWAHLDEAGTSAKEDCCVVAGIVSSPDGQWKQLNHYLADLREEFAPSLPDLVFHAKDIFHGTKAFHRDKWPRDQRLELLGRLSKIPAIFNLTVVGAAIEKSKISWNVEDGKPVDTQAWNYALAFGMCVINFESFMRELPDSREVGTVIAEDVPNMRRYAQFGYERLAEKPDWKGKNSQYLPIERIIEQPSFTSKKGSALLQISDCLAFLLGRYRNGNNDVEPFIKNFQSQIYVLPHQREALI